MPFLAREVHRVQVPASMSLVVGAALLLVVLVFSHFFIQRKRSETLGKAERKVRVWATKSTGLYYCFDNTLHGHTASGQYMTQEEALQRGYTSARNEPCR